MITAAEGQELLALALETSSPRLMELARRVAHDARVLELSVTLEGLCAQIPPEADPGDHADLYAQIRSVAGQLAELAPEDWG